MNRNNNRMMLRHAEAAGFGGSYTFPATGIAVRLINGGKLEVAQRLAGHANAKTTGLYNRRSDAVSADEVERIAI